jgi:hypothetical protein
MSENPHAGQGMVLLDIGGEIGALIVTTPRDMVDVEVEIWPVDDGRPSGQVPHVAVVDRPVAGGRVASLVYPDLVEGDYCLSIAGTGEVAMRARVTGGEVTTLEWVA